MPCNALSDDLWAITSYFNPVGYRRRLANYKTFRANLACPLVTVEWSDGPFELGPDDADILLQVRGPDVLWQKERLLNLALGVVPEGCGKIAWLDCDLVFQRRDWPQHAARLLDESALIQPFSQLLDLPRDAMQPLRPDAAVSTGHSFTYALAQGLAGPEIFHKRTHSPSGRNFPLGLAWAARREILATHALYDAGVVGSGDRLVANAAFGQAAAAVDILPLNEAQASHYLRWAEPFCRSVGGRVGHLTGGLYHLWHGELIDRQYRPRYYGFQRFQFDPTRDIALADSGCWRWNSDKPDMHQYVRSYFASRNEDGVTAAA